AEEQTKLKNDAVNLKNDADAAARKASEAQKDAEANAKESRRQQARFSVGNGVRYLEAGDELGAALWFAEALKNAKDDPEMETVNWMRLHTILSKYPVGQRWFKVRYAAFSPESHRVVTTHDDGTARLWDRETGEPLSP